MTKENWLLLAIGDRIQPIQLQKTLFKFAQESKAPKSQKYHFTPYNWGPCSFEVYGDLDALREEGLVEAVPSGRGWSEYQLTQAGRRKAGALRQSAPAHLRATLDEKRDWVMSRDFRTLLKDVYAEYKSYATQSLFVE